MKTDKLFRSQNSARRRADVILGDTREFRFPCILIASHLGLHTARRSHSRGKLVQIFLDPLPLGKHDINQRVDLLVAQWRAAQREITADRAHFVA